tara:strand:- start:5 stop:700 length:696 start_codon:yes stop_codon:yes gene_type:complete
MLLEQPRPLQGIELVLFDLDGTLIDSVPSLTLAVDLMLAQLRRGPAGQDKVRQWVGNGAAVLVDRALSDSHRVDPDLDPVLQQQALTLFMDAYADCSEHSTEHSTELYSGTRPCLEQLRERGMQLGLVTNKPQRFLASLLKGLDIDRYFGHILGGDTLAQKKPHPLPLQHSINHFRSQASRTLMVGDSATDVKAARAAGVKIACVSYGYSYPLPVAASQPDWLVDCLTELL